jgi:hypothetical protein
LQHLRKARALIDRISTAHGSIIKFADKVEARSFGEGANRRSLALVTVLFRASKDMGWGK